MKRSLDEGGANLDAAKRLAIEGGEVRSFIVQRRPLLSLPTAGLAALPPPPPTRLCACRVILLPRRRLNRQMTSSTTWASHEGGASVPPWVAQLSGSSQ